MNKAGFSEADKALAPASKYLFALWTEMMFIQKLRADNWGQLGPYGGERRKPR